MRGATLMNPIQYNTAAEADTQRGPTLCSHAA
jgi:hypothetical protein